MRKVLDWCRCHPLLAGSMGFICFWLGLYFFLHWRSERAWQRYAAEARARGAKLTLEEYTIPEIPDDENFAALPLLQSAFGTGKRAMELPKRPGNGKKPQFGNAFTGERIDWTAWQEDFQRAGFITEVTDDPVRDTLRGLEHYEPQIQEWREWRTRPKSRFPLDLKLGPNLTLRHLATFQDAARLFSLRMRAHLALGDSAAAYEDFRDGFQAYRALREELTMIDGLVRLSILSMLIDGVGEGLKDRAWSESDLRRIDTDLSEFQPWPEYRRCMEFERAFSNTVMEQLAESPASRAAVLGSGIFQSRSRLEPYALPMIPSRVFRDNQLRQSRYFDELLARVTSSGDDYDLDRPPPLPPGNRDGKIGVDYFFSLRLSGDFELTVHQKFIRVKSRVDRARIACALERFRQARGAFPAALEELVPEFMTKLPIDKYSGKTYLYQPVAPGSFRLYSVGEDRKDDGGIINPQTNESRQVDQIWFFAPPTTAP